MALVRPTCVCLSFVLLCLLVPAVGAQENTLTCDADRGRPLLPDAAQAAQCDALETTIRRPAALPLDEYEQALGDYLRMFCHRREGAGWERDQSVRDTGPFTASFDAAAKEWVGAYHGTHAPVVIWYSEEMVDWLRAERAGDDSTGDVTPVPDGAVMVKEMFPAPAVLCADVDPTHLLPTSGAAVMVRDREASFDGWYWGWFGWSGWDPDWPASAGNRLPYQGFGQYCVNCHASAADNLTFADPNNIDGEALVFLSQTFFEVEPIPSHHRLVGLSSDDSGRLGAPLRSYDPAFVDALPADPLPKRGWGDVPKMPSETYDNVWVEAGGPSIASQYLTSDQCIGCHDAGGTGLQFDMTVPNPGGDAYPSSGDLLNVSPYATWRSSPMGLGGRDPIFYAQLASETDTFHSEISTVVQDTCLGCHGILGQRQFGIDEPKKDGECAPFLRTMANATPWPTDPRENPEVLLAKYGALARDGISCTACHHMLVGQGDDPLDRKQNECVKERQAFLNPKNTGFAKTFTGSFLVGAPDEIYGPFGAGPEADPAIRPKPMEHALGITPQFDAKVQQSELCGSCHTVHLPVYDGGTQVVVDGEPYFTYEQTTYPEWAFSAYRTGETPDGRGTLPGGAGALAESCQSCHMPSKDDNDTPYRSKIAGIQEHSNFPQVENGLGADAIDLPIREGFSRHTLVGLNVFFIEMAQQFPDVLGIRTQDPMLVSKGLDPLLFTEQAMVDQAQNDTANVTISDLQRRGTALEASIAVESLVGHKFPSGVGFRRAFLEVSVLDVAGEVLWASGRTDSTGTLVDETGAPLDGERWWTDDCAQRLPTAYQPHRTTITAQNQTQIYQELVAAPSDDPNATCGGHSPTPTGQLTTSFLSICTHVKDNRLLPHGFLPLEERIKIARALGAQDDLAKESGSYLGGVDDSDFGPGGDTTRYVMDLGGSVERAASVEATLYYQAIPPSYLQDRFCTSTSDDTQRLYFLAGHLNLDGTPAESWKLEVTGASAAVPSPAPRQTAR
ncbi:MAG: hypothetical protein AAGC60_00615 [Acidobacteriota bacterium]